MKEKTIEGFEFHVSPDISHIFVFKNGDLIGKFTTKQLIREGIIDDPEE